jgi:hypothetical protein
MDTVNSVRRLPIGAQKNRRHNRWLESATDVVFNQA